MFRALIFKAVRYIPKWMNLNFLQKCYFYSIEGYFPNIRKPSHIKEVIFKNRINSSSSLANYIDKSKVKDILREINEQANISLNYAQEIAVYEKPEEIDFERIKEPCFIKGTHGCGMNLFYQPGISKKSEVVVETKKWLEIDYQNVFGEMNYVGVDKKILIEQALCNTDDEKDILDIKVHCLYGNPVAVQLMHSGEKILERRTYNAQWEEKNWFLNESLSVDITDIPKNKILEYSRVLSKDFDYVRVDFFYIYKKIYFAEFTFTPAGANIPLVSEDIDKELYNIYLRKAECPNES